ncbi:MAG: HAD-IB family hydrolase [Marinobacterium sp.]|nr:HAD-IB family hydrolase [Marinobacterium sp.]
MTDKQNTIAFFDFDGTLTEGDTLLPFLKFLAGSTRFYTQLLLTSPILAGYALGFVRNDIAKAALLKRAFKKQSYSSLQDSGTLFCHTKLPTMLREKGMQKLRWHQQQGHTCVLVSASLDIYLSEWSKLQGFDHLLCTQLQPDYFQGKHQSIISQNCFGDEKVSRITAWMGENCPDITTYAYGDSNGDTAMLNHVDHGYILKPEGFTKV